MGTKTKKEIINGCIRFIIFSFIAIMGLLAFVLMMVLTEGINFYGVH